MKFFYCSASPIDILSSFCHNKEKERKEVYKWSHLLKYYWWTISSLYWTV